MAKKEPTIEIPFSYWIPRTIAFVFCFTAFILSVESARSCKFFKREQVLNANANAANINIGVSYWGLFLFLSNGFSCADIRLLENAQNPNQQWFVIDSSWIAAQGMACIAAGMAGIAWIMLVFMYFTKTSKCKWYSIATLEFFSMIFQGMSFIIFNTDFCHTMDNNNQRVPVQCYIADGAELAIAAMVLQLVSGTLLCKTPPPRNPLFVFTQMKSKKEEAPTQDFLEEQLKMNNS